MGIPTIKGRTMQCVDAVLPTSIVAVHGGDRCLGNNNVGYVDVGLG